jgi:hypothetical protein
MAADALPIKLGWTAPPECGDAQAVERDVQSMLGETSIPASRPPIEAEVTLRRAADARWDATLRTTTGELERERTLRADSCDEARRAIALLLALMLDPNARPEGVARPEQEKPTPAPSAPPPPPPPPAPPPPPPAEPAPNRPGLLVGVSGVVDAGTLPDWGYGARLRLGLEIDRWSVELAYGAWLPRSGESQALRGAGGNFTLMQLGLGGCYQSSPAGRFSVQGCAGPALVGMRAAGFGVTDPGHATALWPALFAEAALRARATHSVGARLGVGGLAHLDPPTFALRNVGSVHRPRSLGAQAELGLELVF